jgi:hypothetical protein
MTIRMRLTSVLAASVLAASAGLVTGFAAAPAGAVPPVGPTDEQVCTEDCGPDEPDGPIGPGGFEVCTEDCSSHPDEPETPEEDPGDAPIPADANFTG